MSKRANAEINAGSMADIAFLLLIFFLVTTTMNVDSGIMRSLPNPNTEEKEERKVQRRNILFISVNNADKIMVNLQEPIDLSQLKDRVKDFILNKENDPNLPEIVVKNIEKIGNIKTSKATISLQNQSGTSYDMYVRIQNELTRAYNEIREEYSQRYFQKSYSKLEKEESDAIKLAVPMSISEAEPKM